MSCAWGGLVRCGLALAFCLSLVAVVRADLGGWDIGIDPGHGGSDSGAVGPTGLTEKYINLETSLAARDYMAAAGASVYMTRTTDVYVSLASRSGYFNSIPVDRAISVHHNASGSPSANYTGAHVYIGYCGATSGNLADPIAHRREAHIADRQQPTDRPQQRRRGASACSAIRCARRPAARALRARHGGAEHPSGFPPPCGG